MSDRSHTIDGFAEDEQDVVGQAVAGVLEQEPDHLLDGGEAKAMPPSSAGSTAPLRNSVKRAPSPSRSG
jgi:hypothetical protein